MITEYLSYLQEGYIFSDKTISVDLHKFENKDPKKLLILGLTGSGKSSLGRYLAKKYKVNLCGLDLAWNEFLGKDGRVDPNVKGVSKEEMHRIVWRKWKKMFESKDCHIVEGVNILDLYTDPKLRSRLLSTPIIILGKSVLMSTIKGASKDKRMIVQFLRIAQTNLDHVEINVRKFRNARVKIPGAVVKPFEVPKL